MSLGDVPTWVVAIATCVGVIVNAAVVIVALLPIHRAKKQHQARGLLTAANLRIPLGLAHNQMRRACEDLQIYAQSDQPVDRPQLSQSVDKLRPIPDRVRGYLAKFDIADAAYLEGDRGPQLAQAIGVAESAISVLDASIKKFDSVTQQYEKSLSASAATVQTSLIKAFLAARHSVVKEAVQLPVLFTAATDRLGEFVEYLEHLFPSDT